jgi:thiamine biosynthesis protein ThiI
MFSLKNSCGEEILMRWFLDLERLPSAMVEKKVCIALVSGGIDSPVAVARMLREGWHIHPVHCTQEPVTGPEAEQKTIAALRFFLQMDGPIGEAARRQLSTSLTVVPVAEQLALFTKKWCHTEYFIHMKRLYSCLGDLAGKEVGATHLLTGENLGQVSSQTLGNLGAIERVTALEMLRPLLGFDKTAIMHMSQGLGTFELSIGPEVCDALGPSLPTTIANLEWLEKSEQRLGGLDNITRDAWKNRRVVEI